MPTDDATSCAFRADPRADLRHVDYWVFDLDNTLYPADAGVFPQIDARMTDFVAEALDLPHDAARALQKKYYEEHGATLNGLMALHGLAAQPFLDYVHDIELHMLDEAHGLKAAISALPGRKYVFTNGSRRHAERVTRKLGLDHLFDDLFDIAAAGYTPKPQAPAFTAFLDRSGVEPTRAAMFEDLSHNLQTAHTLGFTTVLVHPEAERLKAPFVHHATACLATFLSGAQTAVTGGGDA